MRFDDIFNDIDHKTADRLSKEYPVLKDEQKERLYAMSKRKFDINNVTENNAIDVSGVEKYRRPKWYKGASIAAAAVLLVAGIGSSIKFISRDGRTPAAEVENSIVETTVAVTEAAENTTAAEADADAIAKEMTDAWLNYYSDIYGHTLEVDRSSVVIKTIDDLDDRKFYRVTDPRYPTWEDMKKHCYDICDKELGDMIINEYQYAKEEDIDYATFMFTKDDGYYILADLCDTSFGIKWNDEDVKAEFDENGNIIAKRVFTNHNMEPEHIIETKFTIVKTANGWRISKADENPIFIDSEGTSNETIAKELTDAYRDFLCDLHGGNLEVDKNNVVTKKIMTSDGFEIQREYYLVTDSRYPSWADIEKRCYEIFDAEFGKVVLDNCMCDKEEDINCDTFMFTSDNGYYIEKSIHDASNGPFDWDESSVNAETDENGNIVAVLHRSDINGNGEKYTVETEFTITNTENGWRISKADEKLCD